MSTFRSILCKTRFDVMAALEGENVHFVIEQLPVTGERKKQCRFYGRQSDFDDLRAAEDASKGTLFSMLAPYAAPKGFVGRLLVGRAAYELAEYLRGNSFEAQDTSTRIFMARLTAEEETLVV